MMRAIKLSCLAAAFATFGFASACNDPQSPEPRPQLLLTDGGMLSVGVTTTGATDLASWGAIPPNGYTVWVDGSLSQAIGTNGLVTFSGLAAGDHEVALYGIASNCGVYTLNKGPNNPRGVSIVAGVGGAADFSLSCGSWGGLFVSTNTTGVDLGPGYTVTVDGRASQAIATNGSVTFTMLDVGSHSIALSGAAGNCTVNGSNPQQVTVSAGGTASTTFSASCLPTGAGSGTLTVTTGTTGSNLDPDGYTVTVDGTMSQPIATTNGSATFTVPAGANPVALSGVASNCTVSGTNPGAVTVPAGGTGTATLGVTCVVPGTRVSGTGQLGMGSLTPQSNVQTFDFDVRADLTGRFSITAYDDVHADGSVGTVFADASRDPTTFIKAYRTSSNACSVPSHGVEFDAMGLDGPDLVPVTVIACDDGPQGSGRDFLSVFIFKPAGAGVGRSGVLTSGDIVKN
jgi:hypothetical protein